MFVFLLRQARRFVPWVFPGSFFNLCACLCVCTRAIARLCVYFPAGFGITTPTKTSRTKTALVAALLLRKLCHVGRQRVCSPASWYQTLQHSIAILYKRMRLEAEHGNKIKPTGLFMDLNYCRTLLVQPLQQLGTVLPLITHLTRVAGRNIDAVQPYQN